MNAKCKGTEAWGRATAQARYGRAEGGRVVNFPISLADADKQRIISSMTTASKPPRDPVKPIPIKPENRKRGGKT